jgi:hypothetical protein
MRILNPLLAGAALVTLAVPALASADPYYGYGGREYHRDGYHDRYDAYRRHDYWQGRYRYDYGYRNDWRARHRWDERRGW